MPKINNQKPQKDPTDLFNRDWLILLILVIFAPAGIYLLWTRRKYHPLVRVILSSVFGVIFIYNSMGLISPNTEPQIPPPPSSQVQPSDTQGQVEEPQNDISKVQEYVPPVLPTPEFSGSRLLKTHFIDVGQGDSILIETPGSQFVLVDGGPAASAELVTDYLNSIGVKELLAVVATHPHEDHIGGLIPVLGSIPVKHLYMPDIVHTNPTYDVFLKAAENSDAKMVYAKVGRSIPVDELGVAMLFLAPNSNDYESVNDFSAVLKVSFKDISFLLTGDAESLSEQEMLEYNRNVYSTVLKVGQHGSRNSSTESFLKAVEPVYAVITNGQDNEYGYPHQEAVIRLGDSGANILRTDVLGGLIMETDGEKLGIKKYD